MSCPDCFRGSVLEGEPKGVMSQIDGAAAYFAAGGTSKRAIILLTDIFGLALNNSQILADSFADHLKCDVWVPDIFAGHPPLTVQEMEPMPDRAGAKMGFFGIAKLVWTVLPKLPGLIRERPSVVDPRAISFVKKLQAEKKYESIGAIGYCFGGGVATRVAGSTDLFSSVVLVHPSPPTDEQLKAIKIPTAWTMPEEDFAINPARLEKIQALYSERLGKENYVDYEFKIYKGTAHGFGARPNFAYPLVKEGFEKAFQQAVDWFNKTIPA